MMTNNETVQSSVAKTAVFTRWRMRAQLMDAREE
jgi:hypothetical protein